MEQKKKSARTMRVLGTLLEGSGKYFAVCILLGLLLTVVEMIAPQVIRVTVDSVIDSQPMDLPAWALRWVESLGGAAFLRANMWFIALILALAGLVAALLRYGANMFNAKAGETLVKTARDRLFHHIECLPWKWHAEHPTGDIIQRCTSDVERIKNFFQEQFISVINKYGTDPDVKCIIINQACPGSNPGIDKVAEVRDLKDLLVIYCTPQENPTDITTRADITISVDEVGKGTYMAEKANEMGCKTFVHYSFPRHMAQVTLAGCRDKIKAKCEELGIEFVDATAPDPTGDSGLSGSQQFILEDVPKMVEKYGKETAFFTTNCAMQVPLIKAVYDAGAYYVQPCCPSPYHGFPSAFGIESPEDLVGGLEATIAAEKKYVADAGLTGHFSTWAVPASIANTVASTEYAFLWMAGLIGDCDADAMSALLSDYCGAEAALTPFVDPGTGEVTDNYLVYQLGYLDL